eukprot:TRINITY_DN6690_c0_g1_i1.p2 TRINITY_DN6690_c0_g1~~TRINITY_DN6690_c0_g1_i1.p2  ORF type:complete len:210 (+),score=39.45 TRINITY_DN6690_c0_g1_i1:42-632(+)
MAGDEEAWARFPGEYGDVFQQIALEVAGPLWDWDLSCAVPPDLLRMYHVCTAWRQALDGDSHRVAGRLRAEGYKTGKLQLMTAVCVDDYDLRCPVYVAEADSRVVVWNAYDKPHIVVGGEPNPLQQDTNPMLHGQRLLWFSWGNISPGTTNIIFNGEAVPLLLPWFCRVDITLHGPGWCSLCIFNNAEQKAIGAPR